MCNFFSKNILVFIFIIIFSGCFPVRYLKENEILLNKQQIKGVNKDLSSELTELLKQKNNKRILGLFRFHLGAYNLANKGRETKLKWWIKTYIGEPPSILDTLLTQRSAVQLKLYLFNKGYFNAELTEQTFVKNRKAKIIYNISPGKPYRINNLNYDVEDLSIKSIIYTDTIYSLIKKQNHFEAGSLQNERKRITESLKNKGYYSFSREFIYYEIDSSLNNYSLDLKLGVKLPQPKKNHEKYYINNVYLHTDYNPQEHLLGVERNKDTIIVNNYNFIFDSIGKETDTTNLKDSLSEKVSRLKYKPDALLRPTYLKKGDLFQQSKVDKTYTRYADLGMFKFINILFIENNLKADSSNQIKTLDCVIQVTPAKKQALILETEGTTSAGNPGIAANLIYKNRNIFRGAELFEFKINGGIEAQADSNAFKIDSTFTTRELGASINITFPKYLLPFRLKEQHKDFNPKTYITTSYNMEKRINYSLRVIKSSLSYRWKEFEHKTHTIYPFEIVFVKDSLVSEFRDRLIQTNNQFLLHSFDEHLTTISKYSFVYNNQVLNTRRQKDFIYFKTNLEVSGNTLMLANKLFNFSIPDSNGSYHLLGLKFSQYIKPDFDFRYYHLLKNEKSLVYRIVGGIAIPYGNIEILPFEKQYFVGGTNSLRAWRVREVGPGSYTNPDNIDQSGEIKIESNIEYRFNIFDWLEGAFFADAGNIWTIRKDESRPGSQFEINDFFNEFAIGAGFGIRWDFAFVILRLDTAFPIKDPSISSDDTWVVKEFEPHSSSWRKSNLIYNLGIGYPF